MNNEKNTSKHLYLSYIEDLRAEVNELYFDDIEEEATRHELEIRNIEVRCSDGVYAEKLARVNGMLEQEKAIYAGRNFDRLLVKDWPGELKELAHERDTLEDEIRVIRGERENAIDAEERENETRLANINQNYEARLRALTELQVEVMKDIYRSDIERMIQEDRKDKEGEND